MGVGVGPRNRALLCRRGGSEAFSGFHHHHNHHHHHHHHFSFMKKEASLPGTSLNKCLLGTYQY